MRGVMMNEIKTAILFASSILLIACTSNYETSIWVTQTMENKPKAYTESKCEEVGGNWVFIELESQYICEIATKDGGKECTDNSQCMSFCEATISASPGEKVSGKCYPFYDWRGCTQGVKNGRAETEACSS